MKQKAFRDIADRLVAQLKAAGFTVQRYNAYSTNSVYLKLDYGLAYTIRISDHPGKRHLSYTYNLIKDYRGKRFIKEGKVWRKFYSFAQVDEMVEGIVQTRAWVKEKYHPDYAESMEKARAENAGKRGFWAQAVLV